VVIFSLSVDKCDFICSYIVCSKKGMCKMVISLKKLDRHKKLRTFFRMIVAFFMSSCALFFLCSLISFNQHDQSFFYRSTNYLEYNNWFGRLGAYGASLLLFLLGGFSSLLLVGFFIFATFLIVRKKLFKEADRFLTLICMIMIVATLSNFYHADIITQQVPGGAVGYFFYMFLSKIFDHFLMHLFLLMSFLSSVIIISRLSFVQLGSFAVRYCTFLISNERFINAVLQCCYCIANALLFLPRSIMLQLFKLLSGSDITAHNDSIISFEYEPEELANDDSFWLQYSDTAREPLEKKEKEYEENQDVKQHSITPAMMHQSIEFEIKSDKKPEKKNYQLPAVNWFKVEHTNQEDNAQNHKSLAAILEEKLERFGIRGRVTSIKVGPVITLFEYQPEIDSKISKIIALEDDLALALQAMSIRIIAPIPGRSVVGFEVSNKQRCTVLLGHVLNSPDFKNFVGHLPLVLGQDSIGATVIVDLATMPHLLVAGSTGSGKSVALNTMLVSLLCRHSPENLKLILIDPKRLEFASYADIPHLVVPIVTDPRRAALVLKWVVKTMEERYALMESCNVRNIFDYHMLKRTNDQKPPMPFMVIMIDELSDLMMTAPKETEDLIARITQMARAAGIHMVVATQRPSVDVITGLIKVNFPSRISFRVTSKIDSRTILDCNGADKLLGKGDMLFLDSSSSLKRAHAAFVSDKEIEKLVSHIRSQQSVQYIDLYEDFKMNGNDDNEIDDQLYQEILRFIESVNEVSISLLQRKFRIGYNRSARIIDKLESQGIIMQEPGGKTRKVIR
jgi:DNA segregation ATPase FtsK/SpoIIIE, S-DNA-T family